jgi:hypothetical protein
MSKQLVVKSEGDIINLDIAEIGLLIPIMPLVLEFLA